MMPHHYNHVMVYLDTRKLLSAYLTVANLLFKDVLYIRFHWPLDTHRLCCMYMDVVKVPNLVVGMGKAVWPWVH